jgi:hypothetical protein
VVELGVALHGGHFAFQLRDGLGARQLSDFATAPADEKMTALAGHIQHEVTDLIGQAHLPDYFQFAEQH